jgi:hypothetical protein
LLPTQIAIAVAIALVTASLSFPVVSAQDQEIAIPPCGEVFGIGDVAVSCLRAVNAGSAEAGPVDVYVGDAVVVEGLEYGMATEFAAIPSDTQQIRVVPAGTAVDEATIEFNDQLQPGGAYQLTVMGLTVEELSSWISGVDISPLESGRARVRVVHASPDLGAVDVSTGEGEIPFENIELGNQSGYVDLTADSYLFQLRQTGEDTLLLETAEEVQLEEGKIYDIYAMGASEAGTLELIIFEAEVGIAGDATPAAVSSPVAAAASTPVSVEPGEQTPAVTPEETDDDQ